MKAASYPDFKNVVELINPSSIDSKGQYYLGFSITYATDSIRILEFKTVKEFDNKMEWRMENQHIKSMSFDLIAIVSQG